MSDPAIKLHDVSKKYRLYAKPHYRVLDVFGLLRRSAGAYTEHVALAEVNLTIQRGEKVAIIGRNGAGKSTLLKLITRVTEPTSGHVELVGKTHALLQIGTGFHPEFTGRQNVLGYLAHQGITGKEAERRLREIVDFAELEEYIEQPVKTYSTGMAARLMFATSTSISPDILVLDEVLGVGDAYFARKSYERIRELCEGHGTTVLLVSHDVYSAAKLCERMIWIDRGRILMDASSGTVVIAYEDSIREQEERRLRKKKLDSLRATRGEGAAAVKHLLLEVRSQSNRPQPVPVYFSRISLQIDGQRIDSLPLGSEATGPETGSHLQLEASCWGNPVFWQGRQTRPMNNYGSSFHKVEGVFAVPAPLLEGGGHDFEIALDYWSEEPCQLGLRLYYEGNALDLEALPPTSGQWLTHTAQESSTPTSEPEKAALSEINTTGQQGSGAITVLNVACLNDAGRESLYFTHGEPMEFELTYRINDPELCENAQVLFALLRDGTQDVCRFITRELLLDARQPLGRVRARLPRLPLTDGTYAVTVMIAEEGYYDREQTVFYSINRSVYACHSRMFEIVVQESGLSGSGTVFLAEAIWTLEPIAAAPGTVGEESNHAVKPMDQEAVLGPAAPV